MTVIGAVLMHACASFEPSIAARLHKGWREGAVLRVGSAQELGKRDERDCRPLDGGGYQVLFELVCYHEARKWHEVVSRVSEGEPGHEVWV